MYVQLTTMEPMRLCDPAVFSDVHE